MSTTHTDIATAIRAHHQTGATPWHRALSMLTYGSGPSGPTTRALRVEADILRDAGDAVGAELIDRLAALDDAERMAVLASLEDDV